MFKELLGLIPCLWCSNSQTGKPPKPITSPNKQRALNHIGQLWSAFNILSSWMQLPLLYVLYILYSISFPLTTTMKQQHSFSKDDNPVVSIFVLLSIVLLFSFVGTYWEPESPAERPSKVAIKEQSWPWNTSGILSFLRHMPAYIIKFLDRGWSLFLGGCAYAIDLSGLGDDGFTDRLASYILFSSIARPRKYTIALLLGALWQCINPSDWFNGLCLIWGMVRCGPDLAGFTMRHDNDWWERMVVYYMILVISLLWIVPL